MSEQIIENTEIPQQGLIEPEIAQKDEQRLAVNEDTAKDTAKDTSGRLDLLRDPYKLTLYHDLPP